MTFVQGILARLLSRWLKPEPADDWFPSRMEPFTRQEGNDVYAACVAFKEACLRRRGIGFDPLGTDPFRIIDAVFERARAIKRRFGYSAAEIVLAIDAAIQVLDSAPGCTLAFPDWERSDVENFCCCVTAVLRITDRAAAVISRPSYTLTHPR